jgi:hypothetical protein
MKARTVALALEAIAAGGPSTAATVYGFPVIFSLGMAGALQGQALPLLGLLLLAGSIWALFEFWRLAMATVWGGHLPIRLAVLVCCTRRCCWTGRVGQNHTAFGRSSVYRLTFFGRCALFIFAVDGAPRGQIYESTVMTYNISLGTDTQPQNAASRRMLRAGHASALYSF